jgi:hypothetical protein
MNRYMISLCALTVSPLLFANTASASQDSESDFSIALEAGMERDSQLTVEEIDQYEVASDMATHLQFEAEGDWQATSRLALKGGYHYTSKSYQDNEDFDLDIGRVFGDVSYDFSVLTVGANQHRIDAKLAGDGFLDMTRTGFYAGKLFANSFYLRAELLDIDKKFDNLSDRDASGDSVATDGYFFFNQGLSFFSLGFEQEEETAQAEHFSYDAINYRATFSHEFNWLDKRHRLKLNGRYSNRDYLGVYPEINEARADTKNSISLTWDLFFTDHFSMISHLQQTDADSNLSSADYDATQLSIIFRLDI